MQLQRVPVQGLDDLVVFSFADLGFLLVLVLQPVDFPLEEGLESSLGLVSLWCGKKR